MLVSVLCRRPRRPGHSRRLRVPLSCCLVDVVRGHDGGRGIDHEDISGASDGGTDHRLSSHVPQRPAAFERRRQQASAIPPVGHRYQVRAPPIARRREPEVTVIPLPSYVELPSGQIVSTLA